MRHKVAGRGFGRNANQRKALLRGLVTSLIEHLKIETTVAKAKEARRLAERVITFSKKGDLHSRRLALSHIPNNKIITKLFNEIAPKITRTSGYLRVVKTRFRAGDNSDMAILEFVDYDLLKPEKKEEKKEARKEAKKEVKKENKEEKTEVKKEKKKAKTAKKEVKE
ncbi:MAG: 50S ribosomal protein L17 [Nitrospirae bacterium]|nr:50S ribosomal protein L17 [Nitrospirota bacterium]